VNGQAISNGAAITVTQKVILKPTTNHAAAALTSTYLSTANITTLKSASWASAGSSVSNTIAELSAGQYLVYVNGALLAGGSGVDGRILMQSVIGGTTSLVTFAKIIPATSTISIPTYHVSGAYVSSAVPVGVTCSIYGNVAITNDASLTTFSIERQ
jgi:hypothetical protein